MSKRIFSTVLLWLIVIATLCWGRTPGAVALIGLISVLTLLEFYRLIESAGLPSFTRLGAVAGGLITLKPWLEQHLDFLIGPVLALSVLLFSILILCAHRTQKQVETLAGTLFGLVYIPWMLQYLVRIVVADPSLPSRGLLLFVWLVAVAKFCDVGALLSGLCFGRHHMAPTISPKKTWEGAIGGVLVSMAVGAALAWLFRDQLPPAFTPLIAALFAAPLAVTAILSDLLESLIKRRAAIKDSGGVIPGIGGMFDLCDSLILTAPLGYLLLVCLL